MAENTIESFEEAFRLRVDTLEFDVHFTRDNVLIVMHDTLVNRTTDGTGAINFKTLEEMKALDAGIKFGEKFRGLRVPTLRETLQCVSRAGYDVNLNLEIKDYRPAVVDKTIEMLNEFGMLDRTVIACFDAPVLRYIRDYYPGMRYQGFPPVFMGRSDAKIFDGMYGMGIPIHGDAIKSEEDIKAFFEHARANGIEPWPFHGDNTEDIETCLKFKPTNITSNDPRVLINYLRAHNLRK